MCLYKVMGISHLISLIFFLQRRDLSSLYKALILFHSALFSVCKTYLSQAVFALFLFIVELFVFATFYCRTSVSFSLLIYEVLC